VPESSNNDFLSFYFGPAAGELLSLDPLFLIRWFARLACQICYLSRFLISRYPYLRYFGIVHIWHICGIDQCWLIAKLCQLPLMLFCSDYIKFKHWPVSFVCADLLFCFEFKIYLFRTFIIFLSHALQN